MKRPPTGLCIPVAVATETHKQGIYDGDTIKLHPAWSDLVFSLRLLNCWCPEVVIRGKAKQYPKAKQDKILRAGNEAREALVQLTSQAQEMRFAVPFSIMEGMDLFSMLTFGRVLGHLWCDDVNAAEFLWDNRLAFLTKEDCIKAGLA